MILRPCVSRSSVWLPTQTSASTFGAESRRIVESDMSQEQVAKDIVRLYQDMMNDGNPAGRRDSSMPATKVVHVITGLRRHGAETMLAKLLEVMDRGRFQQTVIVLQDKGELGPRIEQAGVPVIALRYEERARLSSRSPPHPVYSEKEKPNVVQTWLYHADFMGYARRKGGEAAPG